jgi:SAM-dependent methyltransferase
MDLKINNNCQFCKSKKLQIINFFGYFPTVNDYNKKKLSNQKLFPMTLLKCRGCELFQLREIINKKILFPKSYPYTSSTTKILRDNFNELSERLVSNKYISRDELLLDIGSNDGNLLSFFKDKCKILGITPENIGRKAVSKGIPTILDYFNNKSSKFIKKKYGKCKIITATNVFAHIDNINNVLKNIKNILQNDGIFISENHYFLDVIQTIQYDTIYHEHLRYYTLSHLKKLFYKNEMEIFNVERISTHGGSIRVYASRRGKYDINPSVKKFLNKEKKLLTNSNLSNFVDKIINSKKEFLKILLNLKKQKKLVMGIGAPSRSTTLINFTGINSKLCKYILEINGSHKIGKYVPANDIKIISENNINKLKPDYLVIFSWHIHKSLIKNFKKKGFKGKFIIPLPLPKIIN